MRAMALGGVLLSVTAFMPIQASAREPTTVTDDCYHVDVRPRSIMFACADGGYYVTHLDWLRWRGRRADGVGLFHRNDCIPNCAGGTFHNRRGTISLRHRLWCPDVGRYVYRRALITYRRPLAGRTRTRFRLFCPLG